MKTKHYQRMLCLLLAAGVVCSALILPIPNASGTSARESPRETGLVAEWRFEEGSGTVAHDTSGNGNDGTLNGPGWVAGRNGTALNFDGTNDYVTVADSSSLRITGALTIEVWWCGTLVSNNERPQWVGKGGWDVNSGYELGFASTQLPTLSGEIDISTGHSGIPSKAGTLKENEWQYIVGTINVTSAKIYRNGVEVANGTVNALTTNNRALNIGRRDPGNNFAGYVTGRIDEIRIFNRTLSAGEIKARYDAAANSSGLVAEWLFEEGSGSVAHDTSGNGNDGTLNNGPSWTAGRNGTALSFDGTNDYVEVADSSSLRLTGALTIEVWWCGTLTSTNDCPMWVSKGGWDIGSGYEMGFGSTLAVNPGIIDLSTGLSDVATPVGTLKENEWQHIVGTINGTSAKIYRNGVEVASGTVNSLTTNSRSLNIGRRDPGNNFAGYVTGRIDEVKIYNYALSASEISAKFNGTAKPDLALTRSDISFSPTPHAVNGTPVTIAANIRNIGLCATASSIAKFYKGDPAAGGTQIGTTQNIAGIAAFGSRQVSISWTPDRIGTYQIYVELTGTAPAESDTYNNKAFTDLLVLAQSDLMAEWLFDEGSGTVAHDTSGNGNDGTIHDATWSSDSGRNVLKFDGNEDFVRIPNSPSLDLEGNISVEAWFNFEQGGSENPRILHKHEAYQIYTWGTNPARPLSFAVANRSIDSNPDWLCQVISNRTLNANNWYHVVGTCDGNSIKLYINGELDCLKIQPNLLHPNHDDVKIGSNVDNTLDDFKGRIDEVRIYDRALSASEIKAKFDAAAKPDLTLTRSDISFSPPVAANGTPVTINAIVRNPGSSEAVSSSVKFYKGDPATGGAQIGATQTISNIAANGNKQASISWTPDRIGTYQIHVEISATTPAESDTSNNKAYINLVVLNQSGLMAEWLFDEGSGSVAHDTSGNGNDGTLHDATWFSDSGRKGLKFDGNEDYVRILDSPSLDVEGNLSIEAWFNFEEGGSENPVILHKHEAYNIFSLGTGTVRHVQFCLSDDYLYKQDPGRYYFRLTSNKTLNANDWHHVVGTYDGLTVRLYINGELDSSISVPPVPRRPANDEIKLGSSVHNNLDDFKGRIDEIRLYNRALNAGEIKAKYDAFGRADLGLAASDITISPSTTVVNGTSLSISASVRNLGPSTLSSSSVKFYKGDPATGGIQIGTTQTITNLACNGSKQVSISWTPDIAGTYPIYVEISGTTPMDTNLGNDRAFVAIIVLSKPDLSVTTADIVTSMSKIVEGGMVNISVTIRNYGQWDASSVVVRFLDGANQIGTDVIIPSVKGNGGSAQATVTWKASPKGEHVITVRIDPNGLISESDEANNMANLTITVKSRQIQTKTPGFESACAGIAITISLAMIYHRRRKSNV